MDQGGPGMSIIFLGYKATEDGGRRLAAHHWPASVRLGIGVFLAGILGAAVAGLGPTPAQAGERDFGAARPAWFGSTTVLEVAELEEQRGGALDSAPGLDAPQGGEIAVILWDELSGKHSVVAAINETVSVVGVK